MFVTVVVPFLPFGVLGGTPDTYQQAGIRRGTATSLQQVPGQPRQYTSIRYGERLAELGAVPSIGSIGDSYDNALAETVNGLYKTELIRGPGQGPWKTVEDVELATLGWVHWHNTARLHGYLDDVPPVEFEAAWHHERESLIQAIAQTISALVTTKSLRSNMTGITELDNEMPTRQTCTHANAIVT